MLLEVVSVPCARPVDVWCLLVFTACGPPLHDRASDTTFQPGSQALSVRAGSASGARSPRGLSTGVWPGEGHDLRRCVTDAR